jgi:hypothetical protein
LNLCYILSIRGFFVGNTVAVEPTTFVRAQVRATSVPWYVRTSLIASACAIVGELWDISWHISIGRDTFWTPAHLLIQLCAVLGASTCAWLLLRTTFSKDPGVRAASVRVLGFRGPMGAFVVMWGAGAMLASAPFDNWWHNAYGLDVKILSPPHVLLVLGIVCVEFGGLLLALGSMNTADGISRGRLDWIFLCIGGILLTQAMFLGGDYMVRSLMHSAIFCLTASLAVPVVLVAIAEASGKRWAMTTVAAIYMAFLIAMMQILRLFPAQTKLGPVYQQITHFVFPFFPLLLIVPGFFLDLLRPRVRQFSPWLRALAFAAVFLAVIVAVQWPFGVFLNSAASRNVIFATNDFAYTWRPNHPAVQHVFFPFEATRTAFWSTMGLAFLCAILTSRLGLAWGEWMRGVRR